MKPDDSDPFGITRTEKLLADPGCKIGEESKDLQDIRIYARGGVIPELGIVYQPIGQFRYLYRLENQRGIAKAFLKPNVKRQYCIEIEGTFYDFKDEPLQNTLIEVPILSDTEAWLEGMYPCFRGKEIFNKIMNYLHIVLDLPEPHHYYNVALLVLQSWIEEALDVVFYVGFEAKYGSGKTKSLEAVSKILRKGFLVGDPSSAAVGRMVERIGLNLCVDELDTLSGSRDSMVYKLFRQGYRRNNPYVRVNENDLSVFDVFDGFGSKAYTLAEDIEPALKQRTLITPMRPTKDNRLPIIDMRIQELGRELRTKLFFWYMDNIIDVTRTLRLLPTLPTFSEGELVDVEQARNELYTQLTKSFSDQEKAFLTKWSGRNLELAFNVPLIQKAFGIDVLDVMANSFEEKDEEDQAATETIALDELKSLLIELREQQGHNYTLGKGDFAGCFYYPRTKAFQEYRHRLREKHNHGMGQDHFMRLLKEIGFTKGKTEGNMRRQYWEGKNLNCLIYDDPVLEALCITEPLVKEEQIGESNEQREPCPQRPQQTA